MTDRSGPLDDLERFIDRLTEHFEPVTRSLERGDDDHADRRLGLPAWEMPSMPSQGSGMTSLDLTDEGDEFVVTVDVPGYDTTDLEVRLDGPSLLISGDHEQETTQTASATEYVRQERHVQSFTRQVTLPAASSRMRYMQP